MVVKASDNLWEAAVWIFSADTHRAVCKEDEMESGQLTTLSHMQPRGH